MAKTLYYNIFGGGSKLHGTVLADSAADALYKWETLTREHEDNAIVAAEKQVESLKQRRDSRRANPPVMFAWAPPVLLKCLRCGDTGRRWDNGDMTECECRSNREGPQ